MSDIVGRTKLSKVHKKKRIPTGEENVENNLNQLENGNLKKFESIKTMTDSNKTEYTVGSISDLITGKNTPNKLKIVKQVLPKIQEIQPREQSKSSEVKKIKQKKRKRKVDVKTQNQQNNNIVVINHDELMKNSIVEIDEQNDVPIKKFKQINNELKQNEKELTEEQLNAKIEADSRTVFVGNVSVTVTKYQINKLFAKYGKIQSVRLRGVAPSTPLLSKRVAAIKKMFHPKRTTLHAYVVFVSREDALKALALNGFKYKEHHLRVELCDDVNKPEKSKAIFIGNLSFEAEDEDLWSTFESCGAIKSVRIVRNSSNGVGLGIGYVNFECADSVELALELDEVTIKKKVVRIKRYQEQKSKNRKQNLNYTGKSKEHKEKTGKKTKKRDVPQQTITEKKSVYRGKKASKNKKKSKVSRDVINKMKLSQKIAPRTTKKF